MAPDLRNRILLRLAPLWVAVHLAFSSAGAAVEIPASDFAALTGCEPGSAEIEAQTQSTTETLYRRAFWMTGCAGGAEGVVILADASGNSVELDRIKEEDVYFGLARLRFVTLGSLDALLLIFGYEPSDLHDFNFVRIYDLRSRRVILSAWTSAEPEIIEINREPTHNLLLLFKDAFLVRDVDMPHWPIIFTFEEGTARIEELVRYPEIIDLVLQRTDVAIADLKKDCMARAARHDEVCEISEYDSFKALASQRRALRMLQSAQPDAGTSATDED